MSILKTEANKQGYICQYCHKEFKREKTLAVHICEQKRRWMSKDDKGVALGLHTYIKFYQHAQNHVQTRTFEDFVQSPYYTAFVKFGNYCINTKCIKVEQFIKWVITSGIKLDEWATDKTYSKFLDHVLKTEHVNDALQRAIEYSIKWGEEKGMNPHDIFRYGSENGLCHAIIAGKLSPWVIYHSESGQNFLTRLSEEQIKMIWDIIDPEFWEQKFENNISDVEYVKEIMNEAGW